MRVLGITVMATLLAASPLTAQTKVGITGGFVSATLGTSDKGVPTNTSAGLAIGAALVSDIAPHFSLAPEVLYIQKGGKFTESDGTVDAISLDYLEIPLLVRWTLATRSLPHSFATVGPTVAFKLSCTDQVSGTDVNYSADCKDIGQNTDFKSSDIGVLVGAGIDLGPALLTVRYEVGLRNVSQETGLGAVSLKNRALMVLVGWTF
jgi:Outer membrane protein beta-barrel domain